MSPLPAGWAEVPLAEVGTWVGGSTPSKARSQYWDGGTVPWLSPKDMKSPILSGVQDHVTQRATQETALRVLPEGVVAIVVRSGILERTLPVALVPFATTLNQDMKAVKPTEGICGKWLLYALQSAEQEILRHCRKAGTKVASLETAALMSWRIPLAPRFQQERIVAAIDEAFSLLDAGEAALRATRTRLRRMRESVLTAAVTGELVPQDPTDPPAHRLVASNNAPGGGSEESLPPGWCWTRLDNLLLAIEAGKSFSAGGRPAGDGEMGVLKVSAMTWGSFRAAENKVLPAGTTIDPRWVVQAGDVLLSRANTSEYVGACVRVPRDYPNLILSDKSLRLVPIGGVHPQWLVYSLRSVSIRRQIEALATGTKESMRNISQAKLRSIRVALPPLEEQARIVAEVERQFSCIEACERAVDAASKRSTGLRKSVLKAAFEGQLVDLDSNEEPASVLVERIAAERGAAAHEQRTPGALKAGRLGE